MAKLDLSELGSTGLRRAGGTVFEEFLSTLRGYRGARVYREMADNDPVIGAILYAIEKVVVRLDWKVEPYSDITDDGEVDETDIENAQFVYDCLNDMSDSWDATLQSILSMLVFGYSYHEIVYKRRLGMEQKDASKRSKYSDGRIGWRKFAIRAQETLMRWEIQEDGGIDGFHQIDPSGGGHHYIPIEKSLLFRTTSQKNNPEGRSLLRNAYRPWFFKRRIEEIEAVGIERDLAGLPVAYVPPEFLAANATPEQIQVLTAVQTIVQNIKRNEQEGIVFPTLYDEGGHKLFDLQLLSSGGTRQFDTDKIIQRYDQRISMTILSDFILLGHDRVGSFSLGVAKMDLWSMAVDAIATSICEVINNYAIPRLMKLNGMDVSRLPYLSFGDVSQVNLTEISDFVSKLVQAGALTVDPSLEDYLRSLGGLPAIEHTEDEVGTAPVPQGPAVPEPTEAEDVLPEPTDDEEEEPVEQESE